MVDPAARTNDQDDVDGNSGHISVFLFAKCEFNFKTAEIRIAGPRHTNYGLSEPAAQQTGIFALGESYGEPLSR